MTAMRQALRSCLRDPISTAAIGLSLALGVGPNAVVFTAGDAVFARPLPFREPDRLVVVHGINDSPSASAVEYFSRAHSAEAIASYQAGLATVSGGSSAEFARVAQVSAKLFPLLGVDAQLGRLFVADDERASAPRVAVISTPMWWRSFGADPAMVGKPILLAGQHHVVVGIVPSGFDFPDGTEVWVPAGRTQRLEFAAGQGDEVHRNRMGRLGLILRLRRGAGVQDARSEVLSMKKERDAATKVQRPHYGGGTAVSVQLLHDAMVGKARPSLLLMFGGAALVLFIALANTTHLLLARTERNRRELAIRAALGAGRLRLLRELSLQALCYAVLASALSVALAYWGLALFRSWLEALTPAGVTLSIDSRVVGFATLIAVATAIVSTIAPAWRFVRPDLLRGTRPGSLHEGAVALQKTRRVILISETAAAVVLLVGAGVVAKGLSQKSREARATLGFPSQGLATFELFLPGALYSEASAAQLREQILGDLRLLPGIESAAASDSLPYGSPKFLWAGFDGMEEGADGTAGLLASVFTVTPDYLTTMGIVVRHGRLLAVTDSDAAVALVSEDLAQEAWGQTDLLGRQIQIASETKARTIVGVVGKVRTGDDDSRVATPEIYVPAGSAGARVATFVMKTRVDPVAIASSVRAVVAALDARLPVVRMSTMDARIDNSFASGRTRSRLLSVFGGLAALLAAVGIYGVMAHWVAVRVRELGVRQAIGATPRDVFKLVIRECFYNASIGVVIGLGVAACMTRLIAGVLYDAKGLDLGVCIVVGGCVLLVALGSCAGPLMQAMRINVLDALREE